VRRDGQQFHLPVQLCLFQQAPSPTQTRDQERVVGLHSCAVGGQRQVHAGGNMSHHLVPTIAACGNDQLRVERGDQLDDALCPGFWRIVAQSLMLCEVNRSDATCGELIR